ncbi:unnamed protein product, partial [Allacma fusca]
NRLRKQIQYLPLLLLQLES